MDLRGRDFLKLLDFSAEEIAYLLDTAAELKAKKKRGEAHDVLRGKSIALIFEKTSTRTRCAFEMAAYDLGMHSTYLDPSGSQIGRKESIADNARVLSRMYDAIEYRGFGQEIVQALADYAAVPVYNGLTNEFHPTQVLADLLTIREHLGGLKGKKLAFMGDCRYNMANSLMVGCAKMGMDFVACGPEGFMPDAALTAQCREMAAESGGSVTLCSDPECVRGADVVYTDIWVSMGEPQEAWETRIRQMLPYQVNAELMRKAGEKALFMHCLPSFHDLNTQIGKEVGQRYGLSALEVADEVFEGPQSVVFDEAENRMHTIKAVLYATLQP